MSRIDRRAYAEMFGPTVGDRIRLGDTDLIIEIERDHAIYGEEVKFGGGKVIRDGMGQGQKLAADVVDTVITNAVILDHWGVVKADIGITGGRISQIGKEQLTVTIEERKLHPLTEAGPLITLYQGVAKGDRMELILQKCSGRRSATGCGSRIPICGSRSKTTTPRTAKR